MAIRYHIQSLFECLTAINAQQNRCGFALHYLLSATRFDEGGNVAVFIITVLNILIYCAWAYSSFAEDMSAANWMMDHFLVSWDALADGRIWTLLTSAFSHSLLLHILMNMLVLRSFGGIVEATLGTWRFTKFYLVAGIISSLAHAAVSAFIMGDPSIPALGASGAISGIVMLFSLFYPREKILLFAIIPVPAFLGAVLFVALDIWGLVAQADGGGLPIGHGAHLGGAFTGVAYYLWLRRRLRNQMPPDFSQRQDLVGGL